jgi:D-alanyl-D-alanine carboxypeptidase/D-alanyl-D-alanine-endopeptidase (penicillin-binding protein 4)
MAQLTSPVAEQDLVLTNKTSNNLHADLFSKLLGKIHGRDGSFAQGVRVIRSFLSGAGVNPDDVVLYDGSGESHDNLVTPRAITTLLTFAAKQPWGDAWRASFPIGGVDGTIAGRFTKSPLKGKVFAKTGTLDTANALSGYVVAASGKTLAFSILANNRRPDNDAAVAAIDRILEVIAATN